MDRDGLVALFDAHSFTGDIRDHLLATVDSGTDPDEVLLRIAHFGGRVVFQGAVFPPSLVEAVADLID